MPASFPTCQLLDLPAQGWDREREMAPAPAQGVWLLSADPAERSELIGECVL